MSVCDCLGPPFRSLAAAKLEKRVQSGSLSQTCEMARASTLSEC